MLFNRWDSYYYSRPISYRSYYSRVSKPEILKLNDLETQETRNLLKQLNVEYTDLGGLARGIRFLDLEVGRRHYNHNGYRFSDEFFIHQWKPTNDLAKEHPTGTHLIFRDFKDFLAKLREIVEETRKKY